MTSPVPTLTFDHLLRLSDDTGLLEHAQRGTPRRQHGYCLDDVARGLVVLAREPDPPADLRRLLDRYLAFVTHAQDAAGAFHNRLSYDRRWRDRAGTGDWWGRALWGLGTVVARTTMPWLRDQALACFESAARQRSPWSRAMAFATLGAAEVLNRYPNHGGARALLKAGGNRVGRPAADPRWPWPEARLHYANAVVAEALIAAGHHQHDDTLVEDGLRLLHWLVGAETHDGHLSPTPVGGWRAPEPRPAYDQQPIEVATLADACGTARSLDVDARWDKGIRMCVDWFSGLNDCGVPMMDVGTGGGFDGLTSTAVNINQGAESTLALLSTLQHGHNPARSRPISGLSA
jgi:hypothetical protein